MDSEIEVGAADDTLRLWRAGETVRQAELRLAAQAANRTALEQRAGSLAGWCNAGLLALGAVVFANVSDGQFAAALATAAFLAAALWSCLRALRPCGWGVAGYDPAYLETWEEASELEIRERVALGYADAIANNEERLDRVARHLRMGALAMAGAPVAAIVVIGLWSLIRG